MKMICPERACPRLEECKKSNGHSVPHERNQQCSTGCELHPRRD
jgi:hypothetical protein